MGALRDFQEIEKISDTHLAQVRYALSRFWELTALERITIQDIVDSGKVESVDELNNIYQRLRKIAWEKLH